MIKSFSETLKNNYWPLAIHFFLTLTAAYPYLYFVDSPDLYQYFNNADLCLQNGIVASANDYWSPLLSWMLMSVKWITHSNLLSFKIFQALFGVILFFQMFRFRQVSTLSFINKILFAIVLSVLIQQYIWLTGSPDLLFLTVLVSLMTLILKGVHNLLHIIKISSLAALLFFAKAFGFVLFLAMLSVLFAVNKKWNYLSRKQILFTIMIFILLTGPWIFLLSKNTGTFTLSSASNYNFKIMNPKVNPVLTGEIQHPIQSEHLMPPQKKGVFSAWNNPNELSLENWNPANDALHYVKIIARNLYSLVFYYLKWNTGLLAILLFLGLFIWNRVKFRYLGKDIYFLSIVALLSTGMYCLILTQKRYLWFNELLILLLLTSLLNFIPEKRNFLTTLILAGAFFFALQDLMNSAKGGLYEDRENKELMVWLKSNAKGGRQNVVFDPAVNDQIYLTASSVCYNSHTVLVGVAGINFIKDNLKPNDHFLWIYRGKVTINEQDLPLIRLAGILPEENLSIYEIGGKEIHAD